MDLSKNFKGTYGTMYYVDDMEKSVQFYNELFDLIPEEKSDAWTVYNFGGHRMCLHAVADDHELDGSGILITQVTDLDGMVKELKNRGVEFVQEVTEVCENGFAADYIDPSGNIVSLFELKN